MVSVLGFVGFAGAGKDTAAQVLVASGWKSLAFADSLKEAVSAIFGWPLDLLAGDTTESRAFREQVDTWWAERLGIPQLTPRWVLRNFGTEIMRKHFHPEIWVANVERRIERLREEIPRVRILLTDMRFPDEIALCRRLNGRVVRIRRGDEPGWLVHGINAANGSVADALLLDEIKVHPSEYMWLSHTPDAIIENDQGITTLHQRVLEATR